MQWITKIIYSFPNLIKTPEKLKKMPVMVPQTIFIPVKIRIPRINLKL